MRIGLSAIRELAVNCIKRGNLPYIDVKDNIRHQKVRVREFVVLI